MDALIESIVAVKASAETVEAEMDDFEEIEDLDTEYFDVAAIVLIIGFIVQTI